MQVRVLGCSGGIGAGLLTTAFLVDNDVLIDAGTGVGDLSYEDMKGIRHVFVTHSHLDHIASIPLLVDSLFDELTEPLVVHAPQVTIDALQHHIFNWEIWPDFTRLPDPESPVLRFEPIEAGEVCRIGGRTFEAIEVAHTVPAVGYLCSSGRAAFCFSGDTTTNDTLWAALNRAEHLDMLIVEVGFPDGQAELAHLSRHYSPQSLAADLAKLDRRPRIAVTHIKPGDEDRIMAELTAALPGYEIHRLQGDDTFTL
jgi:ribonuclease BN (tRNA processing enzyme)